MLVSQSIDDLRYAARGRGVNDRTDDRGSYHGRGGHCGRSSERMVAATTIVVAAVDVDVDIAIDVDVDVAVDVGVVIEVLVDAGVCAASKIPATASAATALGKESHSGNEDGDGEQG